MKIHCMVQQGQFLHGTAETIGPFMSYIHMFHFSNPYNFELTRYKLLEIQLIFFFAVTLMENEHNMDGRLYYICAFSAVVSL